MTKQKPSSQSWEKQLAEVGLTHPPLIQFLNKLLTKQCSEIDLKLKASWDRAVDKNEAWDLGNALEVVNKISKEWEK